ncbi:rod-binding protein [Yunchengibacter salinarum]|uniref:rod-binding protein n=1 Tax=Yunchengibacter salinarum TaxID=3133399 RepID=UPI0035B670D5
MDLASNQIHASQARMDNGRLQGIAQSLNRLRADGASAGEIRGKAMEAAKEFEAVFIGQMLKPMMETVEEDSLFGGGPEAEAYKSLMIDEIGSEIARSGGIGIADQVARELLTLQEAR